MVTSTRPSSNEHSPDDLAHGEEGMDASGDSTGELAAANLATLAIAAASATTGGNNGAAYTAPISITGPSPRAGPGPFGSGLFGQ